MLLWTSHSLLTFLNIIDECFKVLKKWDSLKQRTFSILFDHYTYIAKYKFESLTILVIFILKYFTLIRYSWQITPYML